MSYGNISEFDNKIKISSKVQIGKISSKCLEMISLNNILTDKRKDTEKFTILYWPAKERFQSNLFIVL